MILSESYLGIPCTKLDFMKALAWHVQGSEDRYREQVRWDVRGDMRQASACVSRLRGDAEAKQHMKRRVKRKRKKQSDKGEEPAAENRAREGDAEITEVITAADELQSLQVGLKQAVLQWICAL